MRRVGVSWVMAMVAVVVCARGVVGQQVDGIDAGGATGGGGGGPAGNTHPEAFDAGELSGNGGGWVNPFGPVDEASGLSVEEKVAFARAVDLEPLRDLAAFSGRVAILDTVARERVRQLTGRKNYIDYLRTSGYEEGQEGGGVEDYGYDPLFTFFDLVIDPGYYADKTLIRVEFLPLRERMLEALYDDEGVIERRKKLGRISPIELSRTGPAMQAQHQFEAGYTRAFQQLDQAWAVYQGLWRDLLVIAPDATEKRWHHLSEASAYSPELASAVEAMGAAWRIGDAAGVNEAVEEIAAIVPRINEGLYASGVRRGLERAYNVYKPFEWGAWLYFFSLLGLVLSFGTGRKWLLAGGLALLVVATLVHLFGFATRSYLAERYAIQNQFESMTGLSLGAVLVAVVVMVWRRQWLFGAAAAAVGFLALIAATQTGIPGGEIQREAPILNTSVLLKYHVTTVLVSYGLIALGFVLSVFYLVTLYAGRFGKDTQEEMVEASAGALGLGEGQQKGRQRVLRDLDSATMIVLQLAFWTLGVGILLGAWWADHSWGRWWAFDPKELWALITWIVYLIVIHVRFVTTGPRRLTTTAWLSVAGFVVMLWTYFGVNLLLPGLHAYA